MGGHEHAAFQTLQLGAEEGGAGDDENVIAAKRDVPHRGFDALPQHFIVAGVLRDHVGEREGFFLGFGRRHVSIRRHMPAIEAAAPVVRKLGTLLFRHFRLFVKGIRPKPRKAPRVLDPGRGQMLGGPERRAGDARV
jgi:hypothetical protein